MGDFEEDASATPVIKQRFASGNWGCGAFGGDPQLKSLIQWLAASACGRELDYHVYGDARVAGLGDVAQAASRQGLRCPQFLELLLESAEAGKGRVFEEFIRKLKA